MKIEDNVRSIEKRKFPNPYSPKSEFSTWYMVYEWNTFDHRQFVDGTDFDNIKEENAGGGPPLGYFENEKLADEYLAFKSKQLENGTYISPLDKLQI